jgi:hypothetical protein
MKLAILTAVALMTAAASAQAQNITIHSPQVHRAERSNRVPDIHHRVKAFNNQARQNIATSNAFGYTAYCSRRNGIGNCSLTFSK